MNLTCIETHTHPYLAGPANQPLLRTIDDAVRLVEACWSHQTDCALLYAENLTEHFFDLSSTEAGHILQKLRQYHIRLAVVGTPETMKLSRRFGDLMVEENRDRYFRLFDERDKAEAWLLEAAA